MANQLLIKKTMADMRALSAAEITGLQNNTYDGIQLLGYYLASDTPDPIIYYPSTTTATDNGGSVIVIGTITLEHNFNSEIDVRYFGAFPNVTALDEINTTETPSDNVTNKIQNALDLGGNVFLPKGRYYINFNQGLWINKDNTHFIGEDGATLVYGSKTISSTGYYSKSLNVFKGDDQTISNITIANISFENRALNWVNQDDQFYHQLSVIGGQNITIKKCKFFGFLGDAITLSAIKQGDSDKNRHYENTNIDIHDNVIDGRNNENRNGISVISGENINIYNNVFLNCTRPNMPGAIDIEPNEATWHRCQNINIFNNYFKNIGGNIGIISFYFGWAENAPYLLNPSNFQVYNNTIQKGDKSSSGYVFNWQGDSVKSMNTNSPSSNILFRDNYAESGVARGPFRITRARNIDIVNNTFGGGYTTSAILGFNKQQQLPDNTWINVYNPESGVYNTNIISNRFERSAANDTALRLMYCHYTKVQENTFIDSASNYSIAIQVFANIDNLNISRNRSFNISQTTNYFIFYNPALEGIVDINTVLIGNNTVPIQATNITPRVNTPVSFLTKDGDYSDKGTLGDFSLNTPTTQTADNLVTAWSKLRVKLGDYNNNSKWANVQLVKYANNATLPTNGVLGEMLFNNSIGRPVWYNGAGEWVNITPDATPNLKGIVKASAPSSDSAIAPSANYIQSEMQGILTELRDLKTKLRAAGLLTT
ncbi:hypothetical protein OHD16_05990 [Sphingobacterium sp. ML3W]|uniref:hypothetical protein n=2 Tax=Sphingobacterium sp. ML3W TaxID=1538644 RepID=UPI00249C6766|nr:hypothetical protein [Sphingobacterium sp. ML3W]WFA79517.1 hypothetical protein OGI71_26230 [Sphingobacterium sp. ML3W]